MFYFKNFRKKKFKRKKKKFFLNIKILTKLIFIGAKFENKNNQHSSLGQNSFINPHLGLSGGVFWRPKMDLDHRGSTPVGRKT